MGSQRVRHYWATFTFTLPSEPPEKPHKDKMYLRCKYGLLSYKGVDQRILFFLPGTWSTSLYNFLGLKIRRWTRFSTAWLAWVWHRLLPHPCPATPTHTLLRRFLSKTTQNPSPRGQQICPYSICHPILQMWKLRLREVKWLALGHTALGWWYSEQTMSSWP